MAFAYREVVISGGRIDTEGTTKAIAEIEDVLVNEMGWLLHQDRRSQAGNTNVTLTSKIVLESNRGESGDQSNWYLTITSGTVAAPGSDLLGFQIHSSYDLGTFDTAATGVEAPASHTTFTMATDSDGFFTLWISGDKDGIVLVNNTRNAYGHMLIGRSQHFLDDSIEPFGLYLVGSTTLTSPVSTTARSIAGSPPAAFGAANESEILGYGLATGNEPRQALGNEEPFFTALPLIHTVDDASPVRKGAIGVVSNAWGCAPELSGWSNESVITVSGSPDKEYICFPESSNGLVIRKS